MTQLDNNTGIDKKEFICQGESSTNVVLGTFALLIILLMGVSFIIIFNKASIITGIVLIVISVFLFSKAIKKVLFSDQIKIIYFFGNETKIEYHQCKKMYKSNDEISPINIIKYLKNGNEKKITFVCDDETLKEICDIYFNGFVPKDHSK